MWMKNSEGRKDAMLTMAFMGLSVVLLKVLIGGIEFHIGEKPVMLGTADASVITAILTPTLGAYVARRYTDKRYHKKEEKDGQSESK